mmetsp:Transcript_88362/g.161852  ORF Transcript_88362/g.161852 Transcript_88362/m.161852 type:complete len:85 (-) Transcript_88362:404-658(-)
MRTPDPVLPMLSWITWARKRMRSIRSDARKLKENQVCSPSGPATIIETTAVETSESTIIVSKAETSTFELPREMLWAQPKSMSM